MEIIFSEVDNVSDGTLSDNDDDSLWEKHPVDTQDAEEAIHNREEELQAELQMTTNRLEELKRTLRETKNALSSRNGSPEKGVTVGGMGGRLAPPPLADNDDYLDDEDDFDDDYVDQESNWVAPSVQPTPKAGGNPSSPRRSGMNSGFRNPYENLQDSPVPSGRLSDRIQLIRQRCIDALGKEAFIAAYNYLKYNQVVSYII